MIIDQKVVKNPTLAFVGPKNPRSLEQTPSQKRDSRRQFGIQIEVFSLIISNFSFIIYDTKEGQHR